MKVTDLILSFLFFIAMGVVVLSLVFDMYDPAGYNINLSNDSATSQLGVLHNQTILAQAKNQNSSKDLWSRTIGQQNASLATADITEGDLLKSSLTSLMNIGDYFDVMTSMLSMMFNTIGFTTGANNPVLWFIISVIIITGAVILISVILRRTI